MYHAGATHMRFDDTNPAKEDMEYVTSILKDVKWLASDSDSVDPWTGPVRHASDYFQSIFDAAVFLIKAGKAYVDDSTPGTTH
jgi:glutaminyl-tRNA synthetase